MSDRELLKRPFAHSVATLTSEYRDMYATGLNRDELRAVRKTVKQRSILTREGDFVRIVIANMHVLPGHHIHAASSFINEGLHRQISEPFEASLHEMLGINCQGLGARRLFDAANEEDILDFRRQIAEANLAKEYSGPDSVMNQPEGLEHLIVVRQYLRSMIRERASNTSPAMRK